MKVFGGRSGTDILRFSILMQTWTQSFAWPFRQISWGARTTRVTYKLFGWQKPCYLLQDGYADTFAELMESTKWERYGTESGNPKCANCMVHSGYEASAVHETFNTLSGGVRTFAKTAAGWHILALKA